MKKKIKLFPLDELEPGSTRGVDVEGIGMIIVRTQQGDVHALRDRCSHFGARLSKGSSYPLITAEDIGLLELSDRTVVRCPWHGFEYDVETGRCPGDPVHERIRVYPVSVEEGYVTVER